MDVVMDCGYWDTPVMYLWCTHCCHAYPDGEWTQNKWHCLTKGCTGGTLGTLSWGVVRIFNPEYPEVPLPDFFYPMATACLSTHPFAHEQR